MVEIEKVIDDLTKQVWTFWLDKNRLYLNSYYVLTRKTKRHKWETVEKYSRLTYGRDNTSFKVLFVEDVPFTEEIKKEALEAFMKEITVCLWDKK